MLTSAQGVLFDLDGTLLDTAADLGASLNYLMQKYGFAEIPYEHYRLVASDGVYPLLQLGFKQQLVNFDKEKLRQEFLDYYLQNIATHTQLFPGVNELLARLAAENIPWGIVTNKPEFLTTPLLKCFPELTASQSNISGDTLAHSKPHPAPMLLASKELNVPCNRIWYIGDAERDIIAGNVSQMTTVVAKWGYIKIIAECEQWQADFVVEHPMQLLQLTK